MTTPDYVNSLDGHYWTDGQTLTAAIGQSYSLFTPLQLANYVATLAGGGTRYNAHLLKEVRTYDSAEARRRVRRAASGDRRHRAGEFAGGLAGNARPGRVGQRGVLFQGLRGGRRRQDRHGADRRQGQQRRVRGVRALRRSADRAGGGDREGGSGGRWPRLAVQILNAYFTSVDEAKAVVGENMLINKDGSGLPQGEAALRVFTFSACGYRRRRRGGCGRRPRCARMFAP